MLANLKSTAVKVRNPISRVRAGAPKYTGAIRYAVTGSLEGFDPNQPARSPFRQTVKLALGTESKQAAQRVVEKIHSAYLSGANSTLWPELKYALPSATFQFFADRIRYQDVEIQTGPVTAASTWADLRNIFKAEMTDAVKRYYNHEKKAISPRTQKTYLLVMSRFETFLQDDKTRLDAIKPVVIEKYKAARREKLMNNGGSIALHIAVLHNIFNFAIGKGLMSQNCINLKNESKPGESPKTPARSLNAEELRKLRDKAGDDKLAFLLLRWTGLRGSDAVNLTWGQVQFDQGENGEIEIMTQKRRKLATIPLSTDLRSALEDRLDECRDGQNPIPCDPADFVLYNPYTKKPYAKGDVSTSDAGRKKLYERIKELGNRAGVDVTPHDLRRTFACDMIARGTDIYYVAKMLADTVDTIEQNYAEFIQAAKDAAQHKMDHGIGIEERAKLNREKGSKIVSFPASA